MFPSHLSCLHGLGSAAIRMIAQKTKKKGAEGNSAPENAARHVAVRADLRGDFPYF